MASRLVHGRARTGNFGAGFGQFTGLGTDGSLRPLPFSFRRRPGYLPGVYVQTFFTTA